MLTALFQKIGFSEKEAQIYTALYQRGPNSVSTLASITKIKRTSVYDILKTLLEKNYVISYLQGSTTYFAIDDVQKIAFDQKEKVTTAEKIVQELKNNAGSQYSMQINYYKGQEGYRQMYEDLLKYNPPEIIGWMNIDNFYEGIDAKREEAWTQERNKKGIKVRLIFQDSKTARAMQKISPKINREIKIIPKGAFPFDSSSFIYKNYITLYYSEKGQFYGIRIQHPQFFKMLKSIFEMNWKFLQ